MKKIYNAAQNRSFRRWVRQLFSSWMNRQKRNYLEEILEKLQDMEDSIEIIAREIARQIKSGK
jgi:predicted DNA-binding protein